MAVRRRIPLLDRVHGREHESFEQLLDFLVQPAVLDGDRRLTRQRGDHFHGAP
jgi:hypothetical protein